MTLSNDREMDVFESNSLEMVSLEQLQQHVGGEIWHTGGGCMALKIKHGRWTLFFGSPDEQDDWGWDIDYDDEYVRSGDISEYNGMKIATLIPLLLETLNR